MIPPAPGFGTPFAASPVTTATATATATSTASATTAQILKNAQGIAANASQVAASVYFANLIILKIIGLLIAGGFIAGTVAIIIKTGWAKIRVERIRDVVLKTDISKKGAQQSWKKVQKQFFEGNENDLKVAIMDADKLLNDALKRAGVLGVQLGDRLKNATADQIPNLDDVWQAHKLRNQIAHEGNFRLKRDLAERALAIYEEALRNLGIFDDTKGKK